MAFDYTELADLAAELIEEFGRLVTLHRMPVPSLTDSNKPWLGGTESPVDEQVFMCFVPMDATIGMDPNTVVHEQGQSCIVATTSLTGGAPNIRDQIIDTDGSVWAIQTVKPLNPGPTTIYYALTVG